MHKIGEHACLVTVSTSPNKWSTGFDIPSWVDEGPGYVIQSFCHLTMLMARMIAFPMPTMALISGHAYAGGVFLALCHDFRAMSNANNRFKICVSEINLGMTIPPACVAVCKATLTP